MRKSWFLFTLFSLTTMFVFQACSEDEVDTNLSLNITGLEDLGAGFLYEGWIIVDGAAISTGTFSVDENGSASQSSFAVRTDDLDIASAFVLTIEPSPDPSADPSDVHILAGDLTNGSGSLTIDHAAALGNDFSSASGSYILATPTNGAETDELSGIWFLSLSTGAPAVGLDLPTLPAGWAYEGWVVIDGTPVTTGTFTSVTGIDDADSFSGSEAGPPFPGEDFLQNAPSGLSFPTDLSGGTAVISIEPVPDNSPNPFTLKPLLSGIPTNALDHVDYDLDQNLSFPSGTVSSK